MINPYHVSRFTYHVKVDSTMKLAAAQISISDSLEHNTRKVIRFLEKAADIEIGLVCFPEMCLTGYSPTALSPSDLNEHVGSALNIIQDRCRSLGTGAIVGYAHRNGYALLNRATVLLPDGGRFNYDKINLAETETKYFHPGENPLTFPYKDLKAGIIICRDQNYPSLACELKASGANTLFILGAHYHQPKEARWKIEKNRALPIARAVENKMHVLLANTVGTHVGLTSLGNSLIVDPEGCLIAQAGESEETLLAVTIK